MGHVAMYLNAQAIGLAFVLQIFCHSQVARLEKRMIGSYQMDLMADPKVAANFPN